MFLRDIWPELAKDGEFRLYRESPGVLRFVQGLPAEGSFESVADPDVVGHPEEDDEPAVMVAEGNAARAGFNRVVWFNRGWPSDDVLYYSGLGHLLSRRLKISFTTVSEGTRVEIKGFAEKRLAHALTELGSIGQWPETAHDPHD